MRQLCAQKIVSKVALKYTVLKVRQKISFHAAQRQYTVAELILMTIKRCHEKLVIEGYIAVPAYLKDDLHRTILNAVQSEKFDGLAVLGKCVRAQIEKEDGEINDKKSVSSSSKKIL